MTPVVRGHGIGVRGSNGGLAGLLSGGQLIKKAVFVAAVAATVVAASPAAAAPPAPLDKQNWSFQDNLTWADYKKLPGLDYSNPSIQPSVKKWKVALIMVDYPDRAFTISPAGGLDDLRHAVGDRPQRPARGRPEVLRRLLQLRRRR